MRCDRCGIRVIETEYTLIEWQLEEMAFEEVVCTSCSKRCLDPMETTLEDYLLHKDWRGQAYCTACDCYGCLNRAGEF